MKKKNSAFTLGTVGCAIMAIVYIVIAILGIVNGSFPLGYAVEAFTSNKIGITVLFLAAIAEIVSIVLTQIVYRAYEKVGLISKGTIFTGITFVALIFVFQQQILPIALWILGAAVSVATLSACSEIAKPKKVEK